MLDIYSLSRRQFVAMLTRLAAMIAAVLSLPLRAAAGPLVANALLTLKREVNGEMVARGDDNYDAWRNGMTWQLRKTERRPDAIVQPQSVADVVRTVKFAARNNSRIAVHSGGHSWVSSSVRDGGLLIDLAGFRDLKIDASSRTAVVGPAIRSRELAAVLENLGLGFPVAHCSSIALGGYLLGGGQAWNWGSWGGPACNSIKALDVVDARGKVIRVDENNYSDLFWAARGSGPGFPGVVTNYHLQLYPLPKAIHLTSYTWPLADTLAVSKWLPEVGALLSGKVELYMFLMCLPKPVNGVKKVVSVSAVGWADTDEEARELLAPMSGARKVGKPLIINELQPITIGGLFDLVDQLYPPSRAAVDTFWFDISMEEVMAKYVDHFAAVPSSLSNVLCEVKPKPIVLPDEAYSMRRLTYLSPYSLWIDEKDDPENIAWMQKTQDILEPLAVGHYINETDLEAGPERARRSYKKQNWERIMAVRKKYDPQGLFFTYLGQGD